METAAYLDFPSVEARFGGMVKRDRIK